MRRESTVLSSKESLLESFGHDLKDAGYAKTTAREHIRAAQHFMYWTDRNGIAIAGLNESYIGSFERHLNRCRCPGYHHSVAAHLASRARLFLGYLEKAGVSTAGVTTQPTPEPALVTAFHQWMRHQRGTADVTLSHYERRIRELLQRFGDDPRRFDAHGMRKFILERSQQLGSSAAKNCTTGIRMFLRFLIADGKCSTGLDRSYRPTNAVVGMESEGLLDT